MEETAAASLRFQRASDALAVLMQAEAERTGTKTWVYNKAENCWEWGLADDERLRMHPPGISSCTYDGSQGFSPGHQLSLMMPIRERRKCMTVHGGMCRGTLGPTILLVRVAVVAVVANSRSGYGI